MANNNSVKAAIAERVQNKEASKDNDNGIKAVVAFADRGQGKEIAKLYLENQVRISFRCLGCGTASSELMDVLGLGTAEKDIVLGVASSSAVKQLIQKLEGDSTIQLDARGILFDLNLTGLNSRIAKVLFHDGLEGSGGIEMEQENNVNSLILITVNRGYTDDVMDTARSAGARGGTILRARWTGDQDTEHFYGINLQDEKEIIAIVTPTTNRNTIMETINLKHGLKTEACAMVCSLGIEHLVRL